MKHLMILVFTFCTVSLFAQEVSENIERKGFVFGAGVGGGVISISENGAGFGKAQGGISLPDLKLGWMVNDRLAILATSPGMLYSLDDKDRSFEAIVPTVQYWLKNKWWVNGGLGLGMDMPAFYQIKKVENEDWNFGCAVSLSTGYEVLQKKNFALDLQTRLNMGRVGLGNDMHRDGVSFSVGVGINFY